MIDVDSTVREVAGKAPWADIDYTPDGVAQVAECTYQDRRLIVRRTRLTGAVQRRLWPDWRHFGFLTDLAGDVAEVDELHRDHATVELAIRDLKEGAGMDHVPSGDFSPNSAWLQCAVLAHTSCAGWQASASPGLWTASPWPARWASG